MERPLIGLNMDVVEDGKGISFTHRSRYVEAVWEAGGRPVLLPPLPDGRARSLLEPLQGLVLTGGDDLSPATYGGGERHEGEVPLHPLRETFDLELIREAMAMGLPMLAICLGIQELCVVSGGRLHPFIPADLPGALEHRIREEKIPFHPLTIDPDSILATLLGSKPLVNSTHRQGVRETGALLKPVAWTEDGVIEAVEGVGEAFLLGVQWHPELMSEDNDQKRLFEALVERAKKYMPEKG